MQIYSIKTKEISLTGHNSLPAMQNRYLYHLFLSISDLLFRCSLLEVELLTHRLLVDSAKYLVDELLAYAHRLGLCFGRYEEFVISVVLHYGHSVLTLEGAYLASDVHTLGQQLYYTAVDGVDV